jgi:glutaredoxin-dependent peroxiredoxin
MKLKPGDKAPDFSLTDTSGKQRTLADLRNESDGNILLLFFPLAFSGVCTRELCTTRDNMKFYNSLKASVSAISTDSFFTLREFKKSNNLNFHLLSDYNKEASAKYGALYDDYFGMKGVTKRAAFIIDGEGVIQYAEVLEDSDELPDFKAIQLALLNSRK